MNTAKRNNHLGWVLLALGLVLATLPQLAQAQVSPNTPPNRTVETDPDELTEATHVDTLRRPPVEVRGDWAGKDTGRIALLIHPLAFVRGSLQLGYHHAIGDRTVAVGIAGITYGEELLTEFYEPNAERILGFRLEGQLRQFLSNRTMSGPYLGAFVQGRSLQMKTTDTFFRNGQYFELQNTLRGQEIAGGVLFGWQLLESWYTLDVYLGGGPMYSFGDYRSTHLPVIDPYRRGIVMQFGYSVGIKIR
jgi:hypothetical protein